MKCSLGGHIDSNILLKALEHIRKVLEHTLEKY